MEDCIVLEYLPPSRKRPTTVVTTLDKEIDELDDEPIASLLPKATIRKRIRADEDDDDDSKYESPYPKSRNSCSGDDHENQQLRVQSS